LGHLEVFFWLLVQNYINRIKEQRIFNHFLPCTFFVVCDDEDFVYFNGLCLFISKSAKNWTDAKSYCEVKGGNLVVLDSVEKNQDTVDFLKNYCKYL
jgi:hypothetical protein